MGAAAKFGRGVAGRRCLTVFLCLILLAAGLLAGAVSQSVQGHDYPTWSETSALSSEPCGKDGGNAAHPCCSAIAGCAAIALSGPVATSVPRLRPSLVVGPQQAPPPGHSVAPLFHPPKLSSLT
jgi:hypothetical protein